MELIVNEEKLLVGEENEDKVSKAETDLKRYPKRRVSKKCYAEDVLSSDDEYLYCEDCGKAYNGECPMHGFMYLVKDKRVKVSSTKDLAQKMLPPILAVGFSGEKKAGLGIWTEVELPKNLVFGPYQGTKVKNFKEIQNSGYVWQIHKGGKTLHYIKGQDQSRSNWLRFINCAASKEQQNLVSFQYNGKIYYKTIKRVLSFKELFVWYGDKYAKALGIETKKKDFKHKPSVSIPEAFECGVCHRFFSSKLFLTRHEKQHRIARPDARHHPSSDEKSKTSVLLRTYSKTKPNTCILCGKSFVKPSKLKDHLIVHTGELPFPCDECGKRFRTKTSLNVHKLIHSQEKPHVCDTCGKGFSRSHHLANHKLIHSGQKPFKCSFCVYRCNEKQALKSHVIVRHTKQYPHVCPSCGKGFVSLRNCKKHFSVNHCQKEQAD